MAKFVGVIGYGIMTDQDETEDTGVWEENIVERKSVGDIFQNQARWNGREELHDDLVISNRVSIVADAYMNKHYSDIRYVTWRGVRWKVSSIEVQHPRLILTLGEVYHGPEARSPEETETVHDGSGG